MRPKTTAEVSFVLRLCHQYGQSVVPQGGLTGLVEGGLTTGTDLVLSLERMNQIENIDPLQRTALVQSGVVLQTLQEAVEAEGLMFPLDLGGRGSCTIGGNISTNAGGNRVIRYGMMRDMVLGLEAVLADGTVISSLNQMIKNNAGYDLKQLFIGSEGTLGVVTRAVLRCRELVTTRPTMLVAVDNFPSLGLLLKHMDRGLSGGVSAFEVMWRNFYELVSTPPAKNTAPIQADYPYYVLIEANGCEDELVQTVLGEALEKGLAADAVLASSDAQRLQLWALRDDVEQCFRFGQPFIYDVSLPTAAMEGYVETVNARLADKFEQPRNFTFGHLGDGNLHFVVSVGDESAAARRAVEDCVYPPLAAVAGSVSAEHGIGLEKKPYLNLSRNAAELGLMRSLKAALDPKGILNPDKVLV